jgi:hypothetical protein
MARSSPSGDADIFCHRKGGVRQPDVQPFQFLIKLWGHMGAECMPPCVSHLSALTPRHLEVCVTGGFQHCPFPLPPRLKGIPILLSYGPITLTVFRKKPMEDPLLSTVTGKCQKNLKPRWHHRPTHRSAAVPIMTVCLFSVYSAHMSKPSFPSWNTLGLELKLCQKSI